MIKVTVVATATRDLRDRRRYRVTDSVAPKLLALMLVFFGATALEGQAHAGQILAETGVFVGDTAAEYSLNISSAGSLSMNLMDYAWPSPLSGLTLEITSATQVLGQMSGAGLQTLSITAPGTYYAYVTGDATGPLDVGAYGLTANFQALGQTPVPLPASISLLLGGIAAMLWSARRKVPAGNDPELAAVSG